MISVATIQLCHCSLKAAINNSYINVCLCYNKALFTKEGNVPELTCRS